VYYSTPPYLNGDKCVRNTCPYLNVNKRACAQHRKCLTIHRAHSIDRGMFQLPRGAWRACFTCTKVVDTYVYKGEPRLRPHQPPGYQKKRGSPKECPGSRKVAVCIDCGVNFPTVEHMCGIRVQSAHDTCQPIGAAGILNWLHTPAPGSRTVAACGACGFPFPTIEHLCKEM
jgi:hypothetical protein